MSEQPKRALLPIPGSDAFVRLSADEMTSTADGGLGWNHDPAVPVGEAVDFERNSFAISISREEAIGYGLVEPTDEERAAIAERHARIDELVARQRAEPGPELTLDSLLALLGWTRAYAAHRLHPACSCYLDDDPMLCSWATELGFTIDWDAPNVSYGIADPDTGAADEVVEP